MKKGFIYCIKNLINHKKYIGQTINFNKRIKEHKNKLNKNKHENSHLQKSWNKYGENKFVFYVIEKVKLSIIEKREVKIIKEQNTYKGKGYNLTPGGNKISGKNNPFYNKNHSKKTKEKIRNKVIKNNSAKNLINYMKNNDTSGENNNFYGKKHTKENKKKMRKAKLNNPTKLFGENHPQCKINKKQVYNIMKFYFEKELTQKQISNIYDCSRRTIGKVLNLKHWATKDIRGGGGVSKK